MKVLFLVLCFLLASSALSQEVLECVVIDSIDKNFIENAYIFFKKENTGTVVDDSGHFLLDVNSHKDDSLYVSCLGYEPKRIDVYSLRNTTCIELSRKVVKVEEIIVRPQTATDVMNKVRTLLLYNYPNTRCRYSLNVNHLIFDDTNKYSVFYGSVVCTIESYFKSDPGEYRLMSVTEFHNSKESLEFRIPYHFYSFPDQLIEGSLIDKLSFINKLSKYKYTLEDSKSNSIRISFSPKKVTDKYRYTGYILIDPMTYAIEYIEYDEIPDIYMHKDAVLKLPLMKIEKKGVFSVQSGKTTISFVRINGKSHICKLTNEYKYRYNFSDGRTQCFVSINEVDNSFGDIGQYNEMKPINMCFYDLEEWDYNNVDLSDFEKYKKNKYQKYLKKIKEKYPDIIAEE